MGIEWTSLHGVYLAFILLILAALIKRRDTTMICIVGILVLGQIATENLSASVSGIFNGFIYATKELIRTIFIISIVVSMSRVLIRTGINELMAAPLTRFMRTPALAFWGIGVVMLVVSWFFWPSPGVALIGAVLLPAAVRVGLPALGAAMAMNLFGHGIALSGDYIIQGAPKLTADAAGLKVSEVMQASVPSSSSRALLRRGSRIGRCSGTAGGARGETGWQPGERLSLPTPDRSRCRFG